MYVYVAENLLNIWYIGEKHIKEQDDLFGKIL